MQQMFAKTQDNTISSMLLTHQLMTKILNLPSLTFGSSLTPTETVRSTLLTFEWNSLNSRAKAQLVSLTKLHLIANSKRIWLKCASKVPSSTMVTTVVSSTRTNQSTEQTGAATIRKVISLPCLTTTKMEYWVALNSLAHSETVTSMVTSYCHPRNSSICWKKTRRSSVRTMKRPSMKLSVKWPNSACPLSSNTTNV